MYVYHCYMFMYVYVYICTCIMSLCTCSLISKYALLSSLSEHQSSGDSTMLELFKLALDIIYGGEGYGGDFPGPS